MWAPRLRARLIAYAGAVVGICLSFGGSSAAAVVQHAGIQVKMTPKRLPRTGTAPIGVSIAVRIDGVSGAPPFLHSIAIVINREGRLQVGFTGQAPFPSLGKVLAFNGTDQGRPTILLHVYGTEPGPTSHTFPLLIGHSAGTYGTTLRATLPHTAGTSGYITGLSLTLRRTYSAHGETRSYLSAGCPAPKGFPGAVFPLARTRLGFSGGTRIGTAVTGGCKAI